MNESNNNQPNTQSGNQSNTQQHTQPNNQTNQSTSNTQPQSQPQKQQSNQQHPHTPHGNKPNTDTPEERNRKMLRIGGIILIIVVILAVIGNNRWAKRTPTTPVATENQLPEGCKVGDLFSETTGKPCPTPAISSDTTVANPAAPSGYDEAIRMYAGKVVVFDASCKALPADPTFAAGTRILVANNSANPLTLSAAGRTESLAGYHYFTVPLTTIGNAVVSCNGNPAATVTVK